MKKNKVKKINHLGDYKNYPYSNYLHSIGVKPDISIDKDQDGIVDWEDCDPNNKNKQGILDAAKSAAAKIKDTAQKAIDKVTGKQQAPTTGEGSMIFKESEKASAQKAIDSGKSVTIVAPTGKTETYSGGVKTGTSKVSSGTKSTSVSKALEEPIKERSPLVTEKVVASERGSAFSKVKSLAQRASLLGAVDVARGEAPKKRFLSDKEFYKPSEEMKAVAEYKKHLKRKGDETGDKSILSEKDLVYEMAKRDTEKSSEDIEDIRANESHRSIFREADRIFEQDSLEPMPASIGGYKPISVTSVKPKSLKEVEYDYETGKEITTLWVKRTLPKGEVVWERKTIVKDTPIETFLAENYTPKEIASLKNWNLLDFLTGRNRLAKDQVVRALNARVKQEGDRIISEGITKKAEAVNQQYKKDTEKLQERVESGEMSYQDALIVQKELGDKYNGVLQEEANKLAKEYNDSVREDLQKTIDKIGLKDAVRGITAPKVAGVVAAGVATGFLATGVGAGIPLVSGASAALSSKTVAVAGAAFMTMHVGGIALDLTKLGFQGRLNWYTLGERVIPTTVYMAAGMAGGMAGAKLGQMRMTSLTNEARARITKEMGESKEAINKYFSEKNLKRGYAEVKVGKYESVRIPVNQNLKKAFELNYHIKQEGVKTVTVSETVSKEKGIKVDKAIRHLVDRIEDEGIIINQRSVSQIHSRTLTKHTNKIVADKEIFSISGRVGNNQVEWLFELTDSGDLKNVYVITKTKLTPDNALASGMRFADEQNIYLARIAKLNYKLTEGASLPIRAESLQVTPIENKIFTSKNIEFSMFHKDNVIFADSVSKVIIKDLPRSPLGKPTSLGNFVVEQRVIKIPESSLGFVGEPTIGVQESSLFRVSSKDRPIVGADPYAEVSEHYNILLKGWTETGQVPRVTGSDTAQVDLSSAVKNINKDISSAHKSGEKFVKSVFDSSSTARTVAVQAKSSLMQSDVNLQAVVVPAPAIRAPALPKVSALTSPLLQQMLANPGTSAGLILQERQRLESIEMQKRVQHEQKVLRDVQLSAQKNIQGIQSRELLNATVLRTSVLQKSATRSRQASRQRTGSVPAQQPAPISTPAVPTIPIPRIPIPRIPRPRVPVPAIPQFGFPTLDFKTRAEATSRRRVPIAPEGYHAASKRPGTNEFFIINKTPVIKKRAMDIGAYYVTTTLARTFKLIKSKGRAQRDLEFAYIPEGYFERVKNQFRDHKIKGGVEYRKGQQFVQKAAASLAGRGERAQIQAFRKQSEELNKHFAKMQRTVFR